MLIMIITIPKYGVCFLIKSRGLFGPPERNSWTSESLSLGGFSPRALCTSHCARSIPGASQLWDRAGAAPLGLLSNFPLWANCPGLQGAPDANADVAESRISTEGSTNTPAQGSPAAPA